MIDIIKILYVLNILLAGLAALISFGMFHHTLGILKDLAKKPIVNLKRRYT